MNTGSSDCRRRDESLVPIGGILFGGFFLTTGLNHFMHQLQGALARRKEGTMQGGVGYS